MTLRSNGDDVKRPYRAPRRAAQAEATRQAILDAAHQLFLTDGYAATSIKSIAQAADVSDQTVYATFGDKPSLLVAVGMRVITGEVTNGDTTAGDASRPAEPDIAAELNAAPDQDTRTAIAARWARRTWEHGMLRFEAMLLDAAGTDPRAAEVAATMWKQKYDENRQLFELAFPPRQFPAGGDPDASYDIFFAIDSAAFVRILIDDCGWSWDEFERRLVTILRRQFTS